MSSPFVTKQPLILSVCYHQLLMFSD